MKAKKILTIVATILFVALVTMPVWANHVVAENASLTDQNTIEHYENIKFDISWENSWRLDGVAVPNNWDAAWVFVKWQLHSGSTDWAHCTLNTSGHTAPTGSVVENPTSDNPQTGVFIYRSADNKTTEGDATSVDWDDVKLRWNYGADGVDDDAIVDIKVFAIEMVYIPQGDFYLGDGISPGTFRQTGSNTPVQITTTGVVVKCEDTAFDDAQLEGDGILVDGDDGIDKDGTGPVDNPDYPTGYNAFYIMKYEISQGQYADFLSLLTDAQDDNRYPNKSDYRHTISGSYGNYTATVPNRVCNYISWADGVAYSDWAGMRPTTELEYEKACRGDQAPVASEYAWGNANVADYAYILVNDGEYNSTVSNAASDPIGNAVHYHSYLPGNAGPLRCGIFATGNSTRAEAGASYYGVMELTGNLSTHPVTLGNIDGRSFTGIHGNGVLDSNGDADVSTWPGVDASGSGGRGGCWGSGYSHAKVSNRSGGAHSHTSGTLSDGRRYARTQ